FCNHAGISAELQGSQAAMRRTRATAGQLQTEARRPLEGVNARTGDGRVALATCAEVAGREEDDLRVIETLARRGIEGVHVAWDDPDVDWASFRLVVVRSTWDYPPRRGAFLTWAAALPQVLNPAPILRWNTDKRYLAELAAAGLPVVPTRFLKPSADFEAPP